MLYQLPNGRTIQISIETFLKLTDDELRELTGYGYGREINNPLFNSSISEDEGSIEDLYIVDENSSDITDPSDSEDLPVDLED